MIATSDPVYEDDDLRDLLRTLSPSARNHLRDVLIRDQADRDAIASQLMRYCDQNGQNWADIIDFLTMWPEARRRVIECSPRLTLRVLGAIHDLGSSPARRITQCQACQSRR